MTFRSTLAVALLGVASIVAAAQFRVVDATDLKPLAGAYVFDSGGRLVGFSDENGVVGDVKGPVTVSMLSYMPVKVDADTCVADVRLSPTPFSLPEVQAGANEYCKTTAVFRDVFRNDGRVVLYREGIVDFYYNYKSKSYTRRIRACRQYEHPKVHKLFGFDVVLFDAPTIDLCHIHIVERRGVVSESGDTVMYRARLKDVERDSAVISINDSVHGIYRNIIDNIKLIDRNESFFGIKLRYTKDFIDWTFSDSSQAMSSLLSCRLYQSYDFKRGSKPAVCVESLLDLVVTGVEVMPKQQAKLEMKEKSISSDFMLPAHLPDIGVDVDDDLDGLKLTDFNTF